ncbi:MAG: T9SS type A sorting domain-containing protein [bacterium]|nr:T9SS type A sorting domain-containing protein [bacterium]
MKKFILSGMLMFLVTSSFFTYGQVLGISAWSQGLCINSKAYGAVTSTATWATSYSWSVNSGSCSGTQTPGINGLSTLITYPCCGIYTVSCVALSGTSTLSTVFQTVSVACNTAANLSVTSTAPGGSLCSASSCTLSGLGGTTYTWIPGNILGANVIVAPTSNICYTLLATNALGCFNMSPSYCMSVIPTYTLSIGGNTNVCLGGSTTLSLSGGPSFNTQPGNNNSANPVLTPTVTTTYTICSCGAGVTCPSSSTVTIFVNPPPTVIIGGTSTLCAGTSLTFSALGNAQSYTWSTGSTNTLITVSPLVTTCFGLIGTSVAGCTNNALNCVTVSPSPTLSIGGSNTVCLGSSIRFTASGANSYTWNTSPAINTPTLSALPTASVNYMVYGTGANGCIGFTNLIVIPNAACSDVWPGDANSDGIVSTLDVLELGLQFASTGMARTPGGNSYIGQYAGNWTGTISTGKNKCHADCNGDGVVNNADTVAVVANFALTHAFKPAGPGANTDVSLVASQNYAYPGQWCKVNVVVGSATKIISQLYGIVFDLDLDQTYIVPNSAYLAYTPSFLNAANQNIEFRKAQLLNTKIYAASVRTDLTNVSGNGKIAELWFKVKADAPNNSSINLTVSNAQMIGNLGALIALTGGTTSVLVSTNLVGIENMDAFENSVQFFPNPARDKLIFQNSRHEETSYLIYDLIGQLVVEGKFSDASTLEIGALANGTYLVKLESDSGKAFKKLIIEK